MTHVVALITSPDIHRIFDMSSQLPGLFVERTGMDEPSPPRDQCWNASASLSTGGGDRRISPGTKRIILRPHRSVQRVVGVGAWRWMFVGDAILRRENPTAYSILGSLR